mmetsp:Transcript_25019/g.57491  ORF Transcript_25019/g.57491 Transcript_25019/m.57491 type:complete len:1369 (+) Transcript_25019:199-4305(+)|eukprot:CAMPEP_0168752790 /NCGR_PEP_ID=MMETSP0724-20121128/18587_1 /TAXON_ID=265536 /ORGANISM="Amphiprora sp., Strain CCMP467" /LENGTH=1368 /DNA_ID=CAMNT_0008801089 /DNA_START=166 /DNA_END=4273 /DNA_ORIENTATION=-
MPSAFPATVAEREAELVALQSAFDEYIASSRELEEELDAELAKMQEKLAESTAANAALSAQLETIGPQLTSLEASLTESRQKLKEEQKLRRAAEQAQDEADQRLREMEQYQQNLREECDFVHEELAFKENELDESKMELEVEKQRLQDELTAVREALESAETAALEAEEARDKALAEGGAAENGDGNTQAAHVEAATPDEAVVPSVDDGYVKKLEEELELVTEQLIETEKRLSDGETKIKQYEESLRELETYKRSEEDEDLIRNLQNENADLLTESQRLRDDLELTKEELTLAREECQLQQEELQAVEQDSKAVIMALEEARAKHREEVNELQIKVKEAEASSSARLGEAAMVASTVKAANEENTKLQDEVEALEQALKNSEQDYQNVIEELEEVNARFDEARTEAKRQGRDEMAQQMKAEMRADNEHEIQQMKEQLDKLTQENHTLQQKVDETEVELAAAKDRQRQGVEDAESELVKQLQSQLTRMKAEVAEKDEELAAMTATFEERIKKAEDNVAKLESDLNSTKGQLAEAEANIIVLRREKEAATKNSLSTKPVPSKANISKSVSTASVDREELAGMDESPTPRNVRSRDRPRARSNSPTSVTRLEIHLANETKKLKELQKEYDAVVDQKRMGELKIKRLESDLKILHKELFQSGGDTAVVTQMSRLSSLASKEKGVDAMTIDETEASKVETVIQSGDSELMKQELKALDKKVKDQREYNAQLLSKMLHLQGNIQVYCRIRPVTISEMQQGAKSVVEALSETEAGCFDERTNKWKSFAFDRTWGPDQSQQRIFQDVEPLALSVVDGYNACIFAYGQTGSGKTFTMEGTPDGNQYGISYRTIQKIFHLLSLRAQQQRAAEMFVGSENSEEPNEQVHFTFSLEIGMLEIYNDEVYDLLSGGTMEEKKEQAKSAGGKASLDVRRNQDGRIEVPGLTKEKVTSINEVMELLKRGNGNRSTAATDMNEHSSRSHMVLIVDVYSGIGESQQNKGTLFLVDLAGSERVRKSKVEGDQLKEAGFINKSLSALGNVMEALDRKASHVPYRDSKLTYLLQDSLGGNSRTMMVVTISPIDASHDESVHALQFATRVRRIQIGAAQRNVTAKNLEETVKALTEEMRSLTRAKERTEGQLMSLKRDNARVQDKLQNLSKSRQQSRSDTKTLEVLKKNNTDMAKRWEKEKASREETVEELDKARKDLRSVQNQLAKSANKLTILEKSLEDKENEMDNLKQKLRQSQNAQSAAAVRSRRDQVLSTRAPNSKPAAARLKASAAKQPEPVEPAADPQSETHEVRSKVLALLEKYDSGKVDRIDIIMEKFKGKESLLLDKMTQRYEGQSANSAPAQTVTNRNELAMQRHQERMRRIREKKANG